jgi:L-asparagine transporter-like permease
LTSTPEVRGWRQICGARSLLGVILLMDLNRYFKFESIFTIATPRLQWVIALIVIVLIFAVLIARSRAYPAITFVLTILGLILLFGLIKVPFVLNAGFETVSALRGKEVTALSAILARFFLRCLSTLAHHL